MIDEIFYLLLDEDAWFLIDFIRCPIRCFQPESPYFQVSNLVDEWYDNSFSVELLFGPISFWNTSGITSLRGAFHSAKTFNQPISTWDVSDVTTMEWCFFNSLFNQSLEEWDVRRVTNMDSMFHCASSFNQPLAGWNVSNVTCMDCMFRFANSFNQPLQEWDVSKVQSMELMFSYAESFNQSLFSWKTTSLNHVRNYLPTKEKRGVVCGSLAHELGKTENRVEQKMVIL
jgi:surface protein